METQAQRTDMWKRGQGEGERAVLEHRHHRVENSSQREAMMEATHRTLHDRGGLRMEQHKGQALFLT